jgi:hypothetical protein
MEFFQCELLNPRAVVVVPTLEEKTRYSLSLLSIIRLCRRDGRAVEGVALKLLPMATLGECTIIYFLLFLLWQIITCLPTFTCIYIHIYLMYMNCFIFSTYGTWIYAKLVYHNHAIVNNTRKIHFHKIGPMYSHVLPTPSGPNLLIRWW